MRQILFASAVLFAALAALRPAQAWDDNGHRIIAFIAERYIRSNALEQVNTLLGSDIDHLSDHDLAGASTWADHYLASDRAASHERYDATVRWHFADIEAIRPNLPRACNGYPPLPAGKLASEGPADACIVDKIQQFADELANPALPRQERLLALKFLLNLVGDVHQPMRVGDEHDEHGAIVPVFVNGLPPTTLFDLWKSALVRTLGADPAIVAQHLAETISAADARAWASGAPQLWALEAHQIGLDKGYGVLGRMDRNGRMVIAPENANEATEIAARQLSRAAVRLAYVIRGARAVTAGAHRAGAQRQCRRRPDVRAGKLQSVSCRAAVRARTVHDGA